MFEGVEVNWMPIIGPFIILFLTMLVTAFVYKLLFIKWLPKQLYNYLLGPVCLIGLYIWLIPMNLGFHEFFK